MIIELTGLNTFAPSTGTGLTILLKIKSELYTPANFSLLCLNQYNL